jgi:hypothetical protein
MPEPQLGRAEGHPEPLAAGAGEARAGVLRAPQLPPDPEGLSVVEAGDLVLANDRIALLVESAGASDLYDPWGGKPVGVAQVEEGALVQPADFGEAILGLGQFSLQAEHVRVLRDGSDGGAAVVRATGTPRALPFIEELIGGLLPTSYEGLGMTLDYVLEPGAAHVDVVLGVLNPGVGEVPVQIPLHAFFQDARMPAYVPGQGFSLEQGTETPYVAFVQDRGTSYAWSSPDGPLSLLLDKSGTLLFDSPAFVVQGCSYARRPHARLFVGGPGLDGVRESLARARDQATRAIEGTVRWGNREAAAGVHVHAETPGGSYLTRATSNDAGHYALHVPAGEPAVLTAWSADTGPAGPKQVGTERQGADFELPRTGFVQLHVHDASGEALPARVQVIPQSDLSNAPASFGEAPKTRGRLHTAFPTGGQVRLRVPVGRHRLVVSRGYEYDLFDEVVSVSEGETTERTAQLTRVVQTPGQMGADFHIHTHRSPDSGDAVAYKLRSALGDGLEIPVRSDHEFVAGFEPALTRMGMGHWAYGVASEELTTFAWGHAGVFPLDPDPGQPNAGAIPWVGRTPPDVFDAARARPSEPAIIINHPRNFGGLGSSVGAYFSAAGYDPTTGTVQHPELWDEEFRLVEVFNDSSFRQNQARSVRDWFSLLRSGRPVFAVGSSDSHDVLPSSPVGYPRTYLDLGLDSPSALREGGGSALVRDVALSGAMTVNGGIHVEAETVRGGIRPGGTLRGADAREMVHVRVQAPCWVDVTGLEVWVNGDRRESIDLSADAGACTPTRLENDVMVPVRSSGGGSWVVLHAWGEMPLGPVHPGREPFGVTNPIFLTR